MQKPKSTNPLSRLENQDARIGNDVINATRFVVRQLSGEKLRSFSSEASALLRRFAPNDEQGGIVTNSAEVATARSSRS